MWLCKKCTFTSVDLMKSLSAFKLLSVHILYMTSSKIAVSRVSYLQISKYFWWFILDEALCGRFLSSIPLQTAHCLSLDRLPERVCLHHVSVPLLAQLSIKHTWQISSRGFEAKGQLSFYIFDCRKTYNIGIILWSSRHNIGID